MGEISSFEEVLEKDGKLIYKNKGDSMWPFIREGRDLLWIVPPAGKPKKYEVPLYKRENGQYVLHRIVGQNENGYICCGDNRAWKEEGIQEDQIIGTLYAVIRGDKTIYMASPASRLIARGWVWLYPLRIVWVKGRRWLRKKI